ncbi:TonB-dependent receptor [Pedobacter cryoconitis]|uniref:Iron complex outermembrane receptor protein n=1 Tax=Pedobacter cryoconitis TaxID=188932 RepID=A0A7X0MJD3_9SPHI|nr:TonB-dependent receptor [Pedobacter cryoconitis]MBB6500881.1 iron complex outermembrane receptor protein [Pedobacter cryoconitis]
MKKILLIILLAFPAGLFAQSIIRGRVIDEQGTPVFNITVSLQGKKNATKTDANGQFILEPVVEGDYKLSASALGYQSILKTIHITGKDDIVLELSLQPLGGLNEVVVTASRNKETIGEVPSSVKILNSKQIEIQRSISTDLNQLLSYNIPALTLGTNTATNKGQTLRGRNALVMIDGIPQSTPLRNGERDFRSIDPSVIERIEVIEGSTAIYGNGADGGIINYITRKPDKNQKLSSVTELSAMGSLVNSANSTGTKIAQLFSGRVNKFDYVLSGTYEQTGVNKDANGVVISPFQSLSETTSKNVFAKAGYDINDKNRIEVMFNYFNTIQNSNYVDSSGIYGVRPITGKLGKALGANQGTPYNYNAYIQYTNRELFKGTSLNLNLYMQDFYSIFEYSDFYKPAGNSAIGSKKKGARINFNTQYKFSPVIEGDVTYGVDILNDITKQDLVDGRGFVPEMNMKNYAPYAQLKTFLFRNLIFKTGARYENISLSIPDYTTIPFGAYKGGVAVKGADLSYNALVFNAGLRYAKWNVFNPFVSFSQGFSLYDLGRTLRLSVVDDIRKIETKAIITNNYEVGFSSNWKKLSFTGAYYISTSDLGSSLKDVNGVATAERAPERVNGFEATANYEFLVNLSLSAGYSHLKGTKEVNGEKVSLPATRIAPDKFTSSVNYSPFKTWDLSLFWIYSGNGTAFKPDAKGNYALGEGPIKSFNFFNLYTAYHFTPKATLKLGIDNLFNADYYPVLSQGKVRTDSYIKANGARYNLTMSYSF